MTVEDDPRRFYFTLDCHFRELPGAAFTRIGQMLTSAMSGRDWRTMGDLLGYTMTDMDNFERHQNPGYELLRVWATKQGSTIRVLQSKLQQIERHDIVTVLGDIRQNPVSLLVVIHDSEPPFDGDRSYSLTPEIRGRRELWDGLLFVLNEHLSRVSRRCRYTFFNLRGLSWRNECRNYQGQQVDIDVRHEDATPTNSVPGFRVTEVEPSWHLMSPTQLRYSRINWAVSKAEGSSSSDGSKCNTRPAHGSDDIDVADGLEKLTLHPSFTCMKENNVVQNSECFPGIGNLYAQETIGHALEIEKGPFACETTKSFLDLDLRSSEFPYDQTELPHHGNTRRMLFNLNLRSEERFSEAHGFNIAPRSETSTICLKSDDSLSENCGTEVRDSATSSSDVVAITPSSPVARPGQESGQELMELRESDLLLENENLVSEGFVIEEAKQSCNPRRRHVYFLPKSDMIRNQFPGIWDLPGFHPKLKHKISLISEVMKPYEKTDGWYLIRTLMSDENMTKVHLALTVTHKGKLKHFLILQTLHSAVRRYFLFSGDYETSSISDLIDHYQIHPLIPGSLVVSGSNLPRLIKPIPKDSFNYM